MTNSATPLTVVFDLDGTLIDTAPDLVRATNHVLALVKLPAVGIDKLRNWVGFGARQMILAGLKDAGQNLPDAEVDALLAEFLNYYGDNIAIDSQPYPGALNALDRLENDGHHFAICTNKSEALATKLMRALTLDHRFKVIAGRDTFEVCKPEPVHLIKTVKAAGGTVSHAIMVGDSLTDIKTAKAAHIPVIGVTHGYTDKPMDTLGPDALIRHFDDLYSTIQRIRPIP